VSGEKGGRCWVPVPAWEVPVRWCADAESELDAIDVAALGLLRIAPRTADELAERLGVADDVALSALLELADRDLVTSPDLPTGSWRAERDIERGGAEFHRGSVFVTVYDGIEVVSTLIDERDGDVRLRAGEDNDVIDESSSRDANIEAVPLDDIQSALTQAVGRGALRRVSPDERRVDRVSLARVERLDRHGKPLRPRRTTVWSAVDLLPGWEGGASRAFHKPQPHRVGDLETPVSATLESWLQERTPGVAEALARYVRGWNVDRSDVLRSANITSVEELDGEVRRHRAELAARLGVTLPDAWPISFGQAATELNNAGRWLIIVRRDSAHADVLRRAQASAVEALMQALWRSVEASLRAWGDSWRERLCRGDVGKTEKRERFSEDAARRRLEALGIADRLGPSLSHVASATAQVRTTLQAIERGEPGAGESLTLWLLPLALLERAPAERHAAAVLRALSIDPQLFDDLNRLIDARNTIFHHRESGAEALARQPEALETVLLRVAVSLAAALDAG
jgi:hypothetical protein